MSNVTWDVGLYQNEMRFTADPTTWTASGADIMNIQYAVVWVSGKEWVLAVAAIEENHPISVINGQPIIVTHSNEGIFELN
jgi:hypothetical protein